MKITDLEARTLVLRNGERVTGRFAYFDGERGGYWVGDVVNVGKPGEQSTKAAVWPAVGNFAAFPEINVQVVVPRFRPEGYFAEDAAPAGWIEQSPAR